MVAICIVSHAISEPVEWSREWLVALHGRTRLLSGQACFESIHGPGAGWHPSECRTQRRLRLCSYHGCVMASVAEPVGAKGARLFNRHGAALRCPFHKTMGPGFAPRALQLLPNLVLDTMTVAGT